MTARNWRALIYNTGSTSLSTANVDFTWTVLADPPPTIRGPIIRPKDGRSEAQPWEITVLDQDSSFTANLSDSGGRADLLGRIVAIQRSDDGSTYANLGVGRLADIFLGEQAATYRLLCEDERRLERNAVLFNTTNTTRLFPAGPHVFYGRDTPIAKGTIRATFQFPALSPTHQFLVFDRVAGRPITRLGIEQILNDVITNPSTDRNSNFRNLRLVVGGTTYSVAAMAFGPRGAGPRESFPFTDLEPEDIPETMDTPGIWVQTTTFTLDSANSSSYLHMFGHPPSEATPLHLASSSQGRGLHGATILRNAYTGSYTSSGTPLPRVSTDALDTLDGESVPTFRFRITESANMARWLEDNIYQPLMWAPVTNANGEVVPVSLRLPRSTSVIQTPTLTGSNLRDPHPSWGQQIRETVTVLNVEWERETASFTESPLSERSNDLFVSRLETVSTSHDRVAQLGRQELDITVRGIHRASNSLETVETYIDYIKTDLFDRYGDGPVFGDMAGLSTAEDLNAGDWMLLNLETYPNLNTQARGGARVLQILSRDDPPIGPTFTYLDGGPNVQPLSAPSVSISLSTANPKHELDVTVSGMTTVSGNNFNLQVAQSATEPTSGSAAWLPWPTSGATSGTYNVARRPSGASWWARARNTAPGRIRSTWGVSSAVVATSSLATPTISGTTAIDGSRGTAVWAAGGGSSDYPVEVFLDASTSATLARSSNVVGRLDPGHTRFQFEGLTSGSTYLWGVRHYDPYGGVSAAATTSFATTPSLPTAPDLFAFTLLWGTATT